MNKELSNDEFEIILEKILDNQEKVGNERNLEIFRLDVYIGTHDGGFDWDESYESSKYWSEIFNSDFKIKFRKLLND